MSAQPQSRELEFNLQAPSALSKYCEARAPLEAMTLFPAAPWLMSMPRGDGRQVMCVPGFLANDSSTWPLRQYLNFLGYESLPWSQGQNRGRPEKDAEVLLEHILDVRNGENRITLIGWSLGGVIAREVARLAPDVVREVITYGTPVEGGPKYTSTAQLYAGRRGLDLDAFEDYIHSVNLKGISQPLTVIYSKSDGIVGWRAAIDRYNPQTRHIRVPGSHIGMGTNPLVWRAIAKTLRKSRTPA
ncbi:MAG: esterase/lipase family protein [Gammaproteobacteria bacterium]